MSTDTKNSTDLEEYLKTPEGKDFFFREMVRNGSQSKFESFVVTWTLCNGDPEYLIDILRGGKINMLNQIACDTIADYLEGKLPKKSGPNRKFSKILRDLTIYLKFRELETEYGYDKAIDILESDEQTCIGRKSIEGIVSFHNKLSQRRSKLFSQSKSNT